MLLLNHMNRNKWYHKSELDFREDRGLEPRAKHYTYYQNALVRLIEEVLFLLHLYLPNMKIFLKLGKNILFLLVLNKDILVIQLHREGNDQVF